MDLRQLTYFMAVADTQHLGRAAEKLHLSQPPLTRQIQQLEAELGVQLFKRTPRGMSLTAAGEALAHDARNIHSLVAQAAERAQRAGQGQVGRLDVGVYGSAVFGVVPQVLQAFAQRHPEVELVLHHAQTPLQLPALRQGRVQLVFERLLPEVDEIAVVPVAREPVLLGLAAHHPLSAQAEVDVAELRDETLIVGSSPAITAMTLQLCRAHGFVPRLSTPSSDIVTATVLAATGAGVTLVPGSMTQVQIPGIAYRRLRTLQPVSMDLHCFYLRDNDSPLLAAMLQTVREFRAGQASWSLSDGAMPPGTDNGA
ncbi:LysR family transcriptional regulator [Ideonella livida]|uniref:LysR family transcriptional regulator n=1 Tax=Ideonella livida TaxID=2707176 RepID=A0A7C9TLC0_9BURK|nr:LysR family transcriptional regulator [Ideonella livida]NDY90866.1 LysR family transcriptional regulator [Ideonella livida]